MLQKISLANGTTVLHCYLPNARSVSCVGYFPVGVATEQPDQRGITHLLEHLMFSGIEAYPTPKDLANAFEKMGVITDAGTFRDMIYCGMQSKRTTFAEGFQLLAEVVLNSKFQPKNVENEKRVVKEELSYYASEAEFVVWSKMSESLWGAEQKLGVHLGGSIESVDQMDYQELQEHYEQWYTPERLTLVVVGNIGEEELQNTLRDFEAKYICSKPTEPLQYTAEQPVPGPKQLHMTWENDVSWCGVTFPITQVPVDWIQFSLMANLLTEGDSSLLQQSLREEKGLLYHLHMEKLTSRSGSEAAIGFCTEGNWQETMDILKEELMNAFNFSQEAYEIAKSTLVSKILFQCESTLNHARLIGRNYMVHGILADGDQFVEAIESAQVEQLRAFMRDVLQFDNMHMVHIGPEGREKHEADLEVAARNH